MSEKLTFLFSPIDGDGHFNACIGIAQQLRDRGHTVVFAAPMSWKGKLQCQGFVEELFHVSPDGDTGSLKWGELLAKAAYVMSMPSIDCHENLQVYFKNEMIKRIKYADSRLRKILCKVKPDAIVLDQNYYIPALMDQGVPWILSASFNPMGISATDVPPAFSGYATDGDRGQWQEYRNVVDRVYKDTIKGFKEWVLEMGGPKLEFEFPFFTNFSPYANIYMYPRELDYTSIRPNPPNWYQFDAFVRDCQDEFEIPENLKSGKGKLIYFSMGTIGCIEVEMMKRLIQILAKSPNRFIVSKGPRGDQLTLGDNMWGVNNLPQTKVIPLVDLVITHGGNNTLTESFYYGKRVLVMPFLHDQLDNGQRVQETGLGLQFHPYKVSETELLEGIELLLGDELLERRMKSISQRIQASNSQARAADLVEQVARNNRKIVPRI